MSEETTPVTEQTEPAAPAATKPATRTAQERIAARTELANAQRLLKAEAAEKAGKKKAAKQAAKQPRPSQWAIEKAKELEAEEKRIKNRLRDQSIQTEANQEARKAQEIHSREYSYNSPQVVKEEQAKEFLAGRGIKHPHIVKVVYEDYLRAFKNNPTVVGNCFQWQNGLHAAFESINAHEARPLGEGSRHRSAEYLPGELVNNAELYALWDSLCSYKRPDIDFDKFVEMRYAIKRDCFYLGKLLEKDFFQHHRNWTDFFPRFDPTTLPANYTQQQALAWMESQSPEVKNFLLLATRQSMKSSWSHLWLVSLILSLPDVRVLLVSEIHKLAKDFIGVLRSYFETTPDNETILQILFPEYCIAPGAGTAMSYDCPMARLSLAQSVWSTSMDSVTAGQRFDVGLFDDVISDKSCQNDEQLDSSERKFQSLLKLRQKGGIVGVLGTPWHHNDLYARIIKTADEHPDAGWVYRIDPIAQVKPNARRKLTPLLLPTLVEDDIESFLWPERLDWKFLKGEILLNPAFALSQNFCLFPLESDADIRVTFDEADLRRYTKPADFFKPLPLLERIMAVDWATSISRYADFSCIATLDFKRYEGKNIVVVADVQMDRWKQSDLATRIVLAIQTQLPRRVVIEKDRNWEALGEAIKKTALLRGVELPFIHWKGAGIGGRKLHEKAARIKTQLEPRLAEGGLYFYQAPWNDVVYDQFIRFDGLHKSNNSRKDDAPDAIAQGIETYFPQEREGESDEQRRDRIEQQEREEAAARTRAFHARLFGTNEAFQPKKQDSPAPQRPASPMDKIFGGNGMSVSRGRR